MKRNPYIRRAKVSRMKFRRFLRCFDLDLEATKIASLAHLNRNTVNRLLRGLRERIAEVCEEEAAAAAGVAARPRDGESGRDPGPVAATRLVGRRVSGRVLPGGRIHVRLDSPDPADGARLALPGSSLAEAHEGRHRAGVLDTFWGQAKLRLAKFKGIPSQTYYLHLKECEFRFNHRHEDRYRLLLRLIRQRPLF